jgi:hypothetical protein
MNLRITAISSIVLMSAIALCAQTPTPVPAPSEQATVAPVPPAIGAAKTVFVSNAGTESNSISGRAYTVFYRGLAQWDHYQIVPGPASADLVLKLIYSAPLNDINVMDGRSSLPDHRPRFQLVIVDRATGVTLWSITEFPTKMFKQNSQQVNDDAVNDLLVDLKALAAGQFPS